MSEPKRVLYFAENALSAVQGGGIVAYAVLKGLPPESLLGFYEYRNITPVPEYEDRFIFLDGWRTPELLHRINRLTKSRMATYFHRKYTEHFIRKDLEFVQQRVAQAGFTPEVVYFSGLWYRFLRLAVMAAEHFDLPMVQLNMDDWMAVDARVAPPEWRASWYQRITEQLTQASARSLVSTSNSPRLAAWLSRLTGYRHVAANNCCSDLMEFASNETPPPNDVPTIVYAGAMNQHLQGETVKTLATAVAELNAEGTRVHLHIYTPWEFAPIANSIAMPNAVFYKGQVGRADLADIFRSADFLVTTVTHREGHITLFRHSLSTKLSEYLCAGKPVISMGHHDWHLHEYVQEHGCGFSIPMDENYSRAKIKAQLRTILSTTPETLREIGRRNRQLWERAHDTAIMARDTRRAIGLPIDEAAGAAVVERRGALWVGASNDADGWVTTAKLKAIARKLVDVFELNAVDVTGASASDHPELEAILGYCTDIGLRPTVVEATASRADLDPAATQWSLDETQRHPTANLSPARDVFAQVRELRFDAGTPSSPADRAISQLTVRVSERAISRPTVWVYGSGALGLEILQAIASHEWLGQAVEIGGFLSSPGHCRADLLHGYRWRAVDCLDPREADFIVVTSDTSRFPITEEITRAGLSDRAIQLFGFWSTNSACGYERNPAEPGQGFVAGWTARDYATSELRARMPGTALVDATTFARVARRKAAA